MVLHINAETEGMNREVGTAAEALAHIKKALRDDVPEVWVLIRSGEKNGEAKAVDQLLSQLTVSGGRPTAAQDFNSQTKSTSLGSM